MIIVLRLTDFLPVVQYHQHLPGYQLGLPSQAPHSALAAPGLLAIPCPQPLPAVLCLQRLPGKGCVAKGGWDKECPAIKLSGEPSATPYSWPWWSLGTSLTWCTYVPLVSWDTYDPRGSSESYRPLQWK